MGYQQKTVSTVAVALTVPGGTNYAVVRCGTANVRWRDDGTAPTATVGVPLNAGEELDYDGHVESLQFIRSSAADATLDVAFYG